MNERHEPEDSRGELINYLSGSYCISHVMNERLRKHLGYVCNHSSLNGPFSQDCDDAFNGHQQSYILKSF